MASELHSLRPALTQGLQAIHAYFHRMVDPASLRLYYKYNPRTRQLHKEASPVRDLGTVADLGTLQNYFGTQEYAQMMNRTLQHFLTALVRERTFEEEGVMTAEGLGHTETEPELSNQPMPWAYLDPKAIGEPSSIAHSSMFLLALAAFPGFEWGEAEREELMAELAAGILHQQRANGTYKVYFPPHTGRGDFGWELYSGEAMLAVMTAYQRLGEERYLTSVKGALPQYERMYRSGAVGQDEFVFFANWQSQAGGLLAQAGSAGPGDQLVQWVSSYLFSLHDTIIDELQLYREVEKHPDRCSTVEVACGLEGLVDAYALALQQAGPDAAPRRERYAAAIKTAVGFLQEVQAQSAKLGDELALGGFGHGLTMPLQRIDVTGHVCSAYIKLLGVLEEREP